MNFKRLILVYKETRLEELTKRYNTVEQAKFYIEHLNEDFSDYLKEHDKYKSVLFKIQSFLESFSPVLFLEKSFLNRFVFEPDDIIYVVGQDGLVANTLKYTDNHLVLGINPDPSRFAGNLLPFNLDHLNQFDPVKILSKLPVKLVSLGKVSLKDGQKLYAVNDFYIGQRTHISSRYEIRYDGVIEKQSSSGIIISTGLGSTGWLKSIVSNASRLTHKASGINSTPILDNYQIPWDADELVFSVREAYASSVTGNNIIFGKINDHKTFDIASFMPENGVIFSDGIENDFLSFNAGMVASVGVAKRKGRLVTPV